jgi:hypothetical protein
MKLKVLLLAVLTATAALAADPVPLFNAMLTVGKDHRFVLAGIDGKPSGWLNLGDTYAGYTIKAFDTATSTLELVQDGKSTKVTLVNGAGVKDAPAPTAATLADAEHLFKVMRFDEMMAKMLDQQKKTMGPMLQQQMSAAAARMKLTPDEQQQFVAFQQKSIDDMMSSMLGPDMRSQMEQAYSEIFTKDELDGLSAFYSTPSGQALVDKTPAVSAKMQALMLPRMQPAIASMQKGMSDFMTQVAANHKAAAAAAAPAPAPASP